MCRQCCVWPHGQSVRLCSVRALKNGRYFRDKQDSWLVWFVFCTDIKYSVSSICALQYKTYKIAKGGRPPIYPFVFSDIMGLERNKGVLVDDIKLALKGHVMEDYKVLLLLTLQICFPKPSYYEFCLYLYCSCSLTGFKFVFQFNPVSSLSEGDQFYNDKPTSNDKVQVLICVIPANTPASLEKETVEKIREVRMAASELGENQNLFSLHWIYNRSQWFEINPMSTPFKIIY